MGKRTVYDIQWNHRPVSLSATVDGLPDFVTMFDYDQDDRLVALRQTGQGGNGVADKLITFACTGDGGLVTVSRYASLDGTHHVVTSDYTADELGRLTGLVHYQDPADPLAAYSWTWQGGGNEVEVVTIAAGTQFGSGWMFPMGGTSVHAMSVPAVLDPLPDRCQTV